MVDAQRCRTFPRVTENLVRLAIHKMYCRYFCSKILVKQNSLTWVTLSGRHNSSNCTVRGTPPLCSDFACYKVAFAALCIGEVRGITNGSRRPLECFFTFPLLPPFDLIHQLGFLLCSLCCHSTIKCPFLTWGCAYSALRCLAELRFRNISPTATHWPRHLWIVSDWQLYSETHVIFVPDFGRCKLKASGFLSFRSVWRHFIFRERADDACLLASPPVSRLVVGVSSMSIHRLWVPPFFQWSVRRARLGLFIGHPP